MTSKALLSLFAWSLTFVAISQEPEVSYREHDPFGTDPDPFRQDPDWTFQELKDAFKAGGFVIHAYRTNHISGSAEILATEIETDEKRWIIFRPNQAYRDFRFSGIDLSPVTLETTDGSRAATVETKVVFEILSTDPPSRLVLSDLIEPGAKIERNTKANKAE